MLLAPSRYRNGKQGIRRNIKTDKVPVGGKNP